MTGRWVVSEITIMGFRGFVNQRIIRTPAPFIVFDGPQRSGKSSTLVAIEWCLFGDEIAKKAIGIDERRDWEVRNTNSDEVRVELVLQNGKDVLKITRSDKRGAKGPSFYFELNSYQDTSEEKLRAILGIQPKDYFSSVHMHQEIIRALLIDTPGPRKDSLDRLLGLSELRNIIQGIKLAKISETLRDADNRFRQVESNLNAIMVSKQSDIQRQKELGLKKDLNIEDFSETRACQISELIRSSFSSFANEIGSPFPELPFARNRDEQQLFVSAAKQSLRKLRDEQPSLERQKELLQKCSQLESSQQTYSRLSSRLQDAQKNKEPILETDGDKQKLRLQIDKLNSELGNAKGKRSEIDKRAGTVEEAIKYFDLLEPHTEKYLCPVCEKPIDNLEHLQKHLKEVSGSLDEDLKSVREEIEKYEREIERLEDLIHRLGDLDQEIDDVNKSLGKVKIDMETTLGYEIRETEDPVVVSGMEIQKIQKELAGLETTIKESNRKLNVVEDDIFKLEQVLKVLNLETEIQELLKIKETEEYKELENRKSELEWFGADIDLVSQIIEERIQESARIKLKDAKDNIAKTFRTLANRPDFSEIEINPDTFDIDAVKGDEKVPALSIFNQGDLNCAGISIFLGLGANQQVSHNLGFLILDDPSQSLDATHKQNLVRILNAVPDHIQILISTSESDLRDLILNRIKRKKKRYNFEQWSDREGARPVEV